MLGLKLNHVSKRTHLWQRPDLTSTGRDSVGSMSNRSRSGGLCYLEYCPVRRWNVWPRGQDVCFVYNRVDGKYILMCNCKSRHSWFRPSSSGTRLSGNTSDAISGRPNLFDENRTNDDCMWCMWCVWYSCFHVPDDYVHGLVQGCGISSALAREIL